MIRTLKISDFSQSRWKTLFNLLLFLAVNYVFFNHINAYAIKLGSLSELWNLNIKFGLVLLVFLLLSINIVFESLKWHVGMRTIVPGLSFKKSVSSILTGITLGFLSPWRIGEYPGRCRFLDRPHWKDSILCQMLGSMTQNLANLSGGLFAVFLIGHLFISQGQSFVFKFGIVLTILMLVGAILTFDILIRYLPTMLLDAYHYIKFDVSIISKISIFSIFRYLLYLLQYYLIITSIDMSIESNYILGGAALIFLIQSLVFVPPGLSFLARGEIAIVVWTTLGLSLIQALTATLILWVINLAIPAFIGLILLTNKKKI